MGRPPWKRPDGKPSQPSWQTKAANGTPRMGQSKFGKKKSGFRNAFAKNSKFKGEKPGYGKTGRFMP